MRTPVIARGLRRKRGMDNWGWILGRSRLRWDKGPALCTLAGAGFVVLSRLRLGELVCTMPAPVGVSSRPP
eukprot:471871-Prorocentrum_minimum.AAC.7